MHNFFQFINSLIAEKVKGQSKLQHLVKLNKFKQPNVSRRQIDQKFKHLNCG